MVGMAKLVGMRSILPLKAISVNPSAPNFRVRSSGELSMVRSGIGLMAGKGAAMGLGFAYWLFAARLYPADVVGIAAAAIAGVMLVSQLGVFGLESAIVARYRGHEKPRDQPM